MKSPSDVILRGDTSTGFHIVDAMTEAHLAGPLSSLSAAIEAARQHGACGVWQQSVDNRGRALGDPILISLLSSGPR
jgi:hypothetical protein